MWLSSRTPSAKKLKRKSRDVTPAKKLRQTYLDLGQAKFDNTTCEKCGMVFTPGVEDVEHTRFCKTKSADLRWPLPKDVHIVIDFESRGTVILASQSDPRCKRLKKFVEDALGFCEPEKFERVTTAFVFILDSQAVGFLETDAITCATLSGSENCPSRAEEVSFGVLKVWVHPQERRKGIATMMLDAARAHHGYPAAVAKMKVALSPPTTLGRLFAEKYFRSKIFPVYKL